jgi:hypothetical protein
MVGAGETERIAEHVELGAGWRCADRPCDRKRLQDERKARHKRDPPARFLPQLEQSLTFLSNIDS